PGYARTPGCCAGLWLWFQGALRRVVPPGGRPPRRSASSIIALPIRSLTEPPGLNHSSLAKIRAAPREKRGSSTNGVWPIASSRARPRWIAVADGALKGSCFLPDDSKKSPGESPGLRRTAGTDQYDCCARRAE